MCIRTYVARYLFLGYLLLDLEFESVKVIVSVIVSVRVCLNMCVRVVSE